MKKLISLALAGALAFGLIACGSPEQADASENETITITGLNQEQEAVEVEVPFDPQRIAILDMAALDIIDSLGLGDRVVGSASTTIDYLLDYVPSDSNGIANLGTIKTADLVEVAASEPDIIFIGGRLSAIYNDLTEIAPVVYLAADAEAGVVESTAQRARTIASIFGREADIEEMISGYDARIEAIREKYEGEDAIIGIYSGSNFNVTGNDGRMSLIGKEMGFNNIGVDAGEITSTHGNEASWETLVQMNPSYLFIMDRNTAISSTEGNPAVQETIENDLVKEMDVYKNGNIVYLANPNVWYTAEGGIQALNVMIQDIETELMQ